MTLAAIERYLEQLPEDLSAHDLAVHRALVASWAPDGRGGVRHAELERRAGRPLTDDDIDRLAAMGVLERTDDPDVFRVDPGLLRPGRTAAGHADLPGDDPRRPRGRDGARAGGGTGVEPALPGRGVEPYRERESDPSSWRG